MDAKRIKTWLEEEDPQALEPLWRHADRLRHANVGDQVHLRGLLEISSHCINSCAYCGLRAQNSKIQRYRMKTAAILQAAGLAKTFGYGTVVLQAGQDPRLTTERVVRLIRAIKAQQDLALTLSLGDRSVDDLERFRQAGADRYLLRFESSNPDLYSTIHPRIGAGWKGPDRIQTLHTLRQLGYEVGSGFMVGIPGQSISDLCQDILRLSDLELDMIGVGPFIAHPQTPMASAAGLKRLANDWMTYKVLALCRILNPQANIPVTSAVATLNPQQGRRFGLERGANVIMPNITPLAFRQGYEIYPHKASKDQHPEETHREISHLLIQMGRQAGRGRGDSPRMAHKNSNPSGGCHERPAQP